MNQLQTVICLILLAGQLGVEISGYVLEGRQRVKKGNEEVVPPLKTNEEEGSQVTVKGDRVTGGVQERGTSHRNER